MLPSALLLGAFLGSRVLATDSNRYHDASSTAPIHKLHQFPPPNSIENLAVRQNGDLLLTQNRPEAALLAVPGPGRSHPPIQEVGTFPSVHGLLGIAEPSPDVFVVVGTNFSGPAVPVNGSTETWLVDLRYLAEEGPLIRRIGKHSHVAFPNGLAAIPGVEEAVLIADSALGLVWCLDINSGRIDVAVQVPEMAPVPNAPKHLGVNGIKVFDGHLYWSNTFAGKIYRIQIDQCGSPKPNAPVELVYRMPGNQRFIDDFTHDERGIWGTTHDLASIFLVSPEGRGSTVAMSEELFSKGTSCAFGRTREDENVLYVSTSNVEASKGTSARGGRIVAIDTSSIGGRSSVAY